MSKSEKRGDWVEIGVCPVDAGCIVLADPCYLLSNDENGNEEGIDAYGQLMDEVRQYGNDAPSFKNGFAALKGKRTTPGKLPGNGDSWDAGVTVQTGYGDGVYPVEARFVQGRVAEIRVVFIPEGDELPLAELAQAWGQGHE